MLFDILRQERQGCSFTTSKFCKNLAVYTVLVKGYGLKVKSSVICGT